jgi:hypothetical protein
VLDDKHLACPMKNVGRDARHITKAQVFLFPKAACIRRAAVGGKHELLIRKKKSQAPQMKWLQK